ncbi:hypothetical protein [Parasphingorhabdus sp.]|uniref:hypothetical protein n=1 Tax=Parasphingorhabdus sp. TaxID=2709688 RepID=UPI003A8CFE57
MVSAHDLRRTFVTAGFSECSIDLFKLELLTNHVPQGVTARHYLKTSRLQYLHPEAQAIGDWIEEQARAPAPAQAGVRRTVDGFGYSEPVPWPFDGCEESEPVGSGNKAVCRLKISQAA